MTAGRDSQLCQLSNYTEADINEKVNWQLGEL